MPLTNIKILDLSRLLPGPYAAMILSEFGAEVIKIEEPGAGDTIRQSEPKIEGESTYFLSLNRNKKSLTLNLKSRAGQDIFLKLIKSSDILIEGFRPGVMENLGLGCESLLQINPQLIYCAVTGYGQSGPHAQKAGHDLNYIARSGLLDLLRKNENSVVPQIQIADVAGGTLQAVIGILLALLNRNKTGKGQFVDVSMFEGSLMFLPMLLASLGTKAPTTNPVGGSFACYSVYLTQDNRYLSVACYERKFWQAFSKALEHDEWIPLQFKTDASVQAQLKTEATKIFKSKPLSHWIKFFEPLNICVEPVQNLSEVIDDPQLSYRENLFNENGILNFHFPTKFSNISHTSDFPPPRLGEHTTEILLELGFSQTEINHLKKDHII